MGVVEWVSDAGNIHYKDVIELPMGTPFFYPASFCKAQALSHLRDPARYENVLLQQPA